MKMTVQEEEREQINSTDEGSICEKQPSAVSDITEQEEHSEPSEHIGPGSTKDYTHMHLVQVLHKGSFGTVFEGTWVGARVAVRVFEPTCGSTQAKLKDALDEFRSQALAHPNIVQTFMCNTGKMPVGLLPPSQTPKMETWMVQEWCDRGSLSQYCNVPRDGENSLLEVLSIGVDISSAGAYLHSQSIIHGDLTADNVLLRTDSCPKGYTCKICDIRLSRALKSHDCQLVTPQYGTSSHLPPEVFENVFVKLTPKADIYAAGIILWQALTGKKPFAGLSGAEIAEQVTNGASLPLDDTRALTDIRHVFHSCTAKEPQVRPDFDELFNIFQKSSRIKTITSARTRKIEAKLVKMATDPTMLAYMPMSSAAT